MTINNVLTNEELFALATAEGSPSAAIFSAYDNYETFANYVSNIDSSAVAELRNQFFAISMAWIDKEIFVEEAVDILEEQGFGTKETMAYAGMLRNLYVKVSNPVDPKFKGLQDGDVFSPYIVNKPQVSELFYTFNSDYQNYTTIDNLEARTAFHSATGVSELLAKQAEGLRNKFVEWILDKKLECLNLLINDDNLKDSQVVEVPMDSYSNAELQNLSNAIDNMISALTLTSNGAFNMGSWKQRQRKEDLRLLIKPIIDNTAKNYITPYAFNDVVLKNGVQKVFVENFGGLIPSKDGTLENRLYVLRDSEGRAIGYKETENGTTAYTGTVEFYDPNADVIAVIADKDIMKVMEQEGYVVEAIYNPRTRTTNLWASEANVGFFYDRQKNMIVIKKKTTANS